MHRALVVLPLAAVIVAAAWTASPAQPAAAGRPPVCERMTAARLLENPGLASEWSQAVRSGDAAEIARVKDLLGQIRSAHGCGAEEAIPEAPASAAPRLPPGHPPIAPRDRAPGWMGFEAPAVVTI